MMRHSLIMAAILMFSLQAGATPVYLKVDSRFPSGHHNRQVLINRTKKVQFQRWLRVETKDKIHGWISEDHCVTPLKLAAEAVIAEPMPTRFEPLMDSLDREVLVKGTRVAIVEIQGAWSKVRAITRTDRRETWIPNESLRALLPLPGSSLAGQKVFAVKDIPVYVLPGRNSRALGKVSASAIVAVIREQTGWLQIQTVHGTGFIARADVLSAGDLGEKGVRPLFDLAPLRSAPLPYADLLRSLPAGSTLQVSSMQTLRWGFARLPDIGDIWWPIADGVVEDKALPGERLSVDDLFKRKIFDMASSPAIPHLKFVSAQGVFRTTDGKEWTKLPVFQDKNYPIAIAGLGSIFVGPFVSDDHGETFSQWIRWDSLVATLRKSTRLTPQRLQIQEIRPEDPSGRRVVLKLSIGTEALVRVRTDDQGVSWRAL